MLYFDPQVTYRQAPVSVCLQANRERRATGPADEAAILDLSCRQIDGVLRLRAPEFSLKPLQLALLEPWLNSREGSPETWRERRDQA
jgi:hypothetical protein